MSALETGQLVKTGPYRYSRNPQIVGWGLALLGTAIAGRSAKALILVGFFFLIHRLHTPTEERHLERTFGEEYLRYRAEVPRFLGFPRAG
jgi:protein-S-isoprenylcysteine O-methyltransferase Ste14